MAAITDKHPQTTSSSILHSQQAPTRRPRALTIPLPEGINETQVIEKVRVHQQPQQPTSLMGKVFQRNQKAKCEPSISFVVKTVTQQTYDQQQSPLCRLPYDVRLKIWEACLSDHRWHIGCEPTKLRLLGLECNGCHLATDLHCRIDTDMNGRTLRGRLKAVGRLSLLQVCRTVPQDFVDECRYSETVPLLYKDNVFDFNDIKDVRSMSYSVPSSRFNLIRTLKLDWTLERMSRRDTYKMFLRRYDLWVNDCAILANMKGLTNLYLCLRGEQLKEGKELDAVFSPLAMISAKMFELWLPDTTRWKEEDIPSELSSRPAFKIRLLTYDELIPPPGVPNRHNVYHASWSPRLKATRLPLWLMGAQMYPLDLQMSVWKIQSTFMRQLITSPLLVFPPSVTIPRHATCATRYTVTSNQLKTPNATNDQTRVLPARIEQNPAIPDDPETEATICRELGRLIMQHTASSEAMDVLQAAKIAVDPLIAIEI
ncbi:hypothetical protein P168DRAFT_301345 [Aspergillus campestris IBT 28561]|uniref:DUF7730 domain-containing protein n=1 Tax=Aspergillus campestris (strain IBT 28561) TaxID=1392248 RepID=A0A2I1DFP6_ASPC2|nr:uncharacterized protein P168DRAFT_301345 [Aspergillus campestris IBT 28561]PKY08696.1 hypothetical protein P168DRAFT_301345 [Aspergillus campestris IBT 28561]